MLIVISIKCEKARSSAAQILFKLAKLFLFFFLMNFEINEKCTQCVLILEHEPISSATKPMFYDWTTYMLRDKDENYIYLLY
jgi:hypothetical protein